MKPVAIVGMGMSPADLTAAHLELIEGADVLVGGQRHLDYFESSPVEKKRIDRNLKELVDYIRAKMETCTVVVLASGDPLFFGIGAYLARSLGPQQVNIHPNISTPAAAFARLKEPWQGVPVISLHGRDGKSALQRALKAHPTVAVYTDPKKNPAWVAGWLSENGLPDARLCVLEHLGSSTESIRWLTPEQGAQQQFRDPNIVIIKHDRRPNTPGRDVHLGMPETAFAHEHGLITKAEIRAVTLAKLKLAADHVFWDLGAGSGSVSIEASLFVTRGELLAVEKDPRRVSQIEENRDRFGVRNLKVIEAVLPAGIDPLPDPDRIFIGGGGRRLETILRAGVNRLRPHGILVVNTVLIESMQTALDVLQDLGLKTDLAQIQVSRGSAMPFGRRLAAENPVWIVRGKAGGLE